MPMQLFFKRAKSFVDSTEGTKQFLAQPGPYPQPVPFWVATTATFKQGIKDGSIVNLTPPEQMPGYKAAPPAPEVIQAREEVKADEGGKTPEEEEKAVAEQMDADEQTQEQARETQPQPPFGAQPMTPVMPGPKVGGITGNGKKHK